MGMGDKIAYLVSTKEGGNKSSFARKIGMKNVTSGLVYGWIVGRNQPNGDYQLKICEVYGVSIEWLQNDELPPDQPIYANQPTLDSKLAEPSAPTMDVSRFLDIIESQQRVIESLTRQLESATDKSQNPYVDTNSTANNLKGVAIET